MKAVLEDEARVVNAEERKNDFEKKELEKRRRKDEKKEKREAEEDGDQDDRFVKPGGASSSSGQKRKPEDYPEGEEKGLQECVAAFSLKAGRASDLVAEEEIREAAGRASDQASHGRASDQSLSLCGRGDRRVPS